MRISFRPEHNDGQLGWGYYQHKRRLIWVNKGRIKATWPEIWRRVTAILLFHELAHWALASYYRPYASIYDIYKEELAIYRAQALLMKLVGLPMADGGPELGAIGSTASSIHQLKRGSTL